eukprot:4336120-Pyramimonas_sp.AAC.1
MSFHSHLVLASSVCGKGIGINISTGSLELYQFHGCEIYIRVGVQKYMLALIILAVLYHCALHSSAINTHSLITCSLDGNRCSNEPDSSNYNIEDVLDEDICITDEMATRQQQFNNDGPLFVDREGMVHYSGDPVYGDDFEERAILGYQRAKRISRNSS